MKIYLINLDRSPGRLAWFMGQVEGKGLDVVRVPAIDARLLDENEFNRLLKLTSGQNSMSPAEMSCLLSHRKVWQLVVEGEDEWGFVAEDDIHLSADAAQFLKDDRWIPAGAEIVRAETDLRRQEMSYRVWGEPFGHALRQLRSKQLGAAGYFVSRSAARRLLTHTDRHCEPVDVVLFAPVVGLVHDLCVLQLAPALCIQDMWALDASRGGALTSQIGEDRRNFHSNDPRSARRRGVKKLLHEFRRLGRQLGAPIRRSFLTTIRRSVFGRVPVALEAVSTLPLHCEK